MMKWSHVLIVASCVGGLSACNNKPKDEPTEVAPKAPNREMSQTADLCQATMVSDYLGLEPTPEVKQKITAAVGKREVRYLSAGNPPPAGRDFNRLNADLSPEGRIDMFWCG